MRSVAAPGIPPAGVAVCPQCKGTGGWRDLHKLTECPSCNGTGMTKDPLVVTARKDEPAAACIPAFQNRVDAWMMECFGREISADRIERNHRFLEEALELVQAIGCTRDEAFSLVNYVFARDTGEPRQEVGGAMVTLAALCLANNLDMVECGEIELARVWTKVEQIRAKQAAKPRHSPLPAFPITSGTPSVDAVSADAPSRAHDLADAIIERVLNLDEYSSPDGDPDLLLVKRNKLHFIASEEATAALSAKDAALQIQCVQTNLYLGAVEQAGIEIARLRDALTAERHLRVNGYTRASAKQLGEDAHAAACMSAGDLRRWVNTKTDAALSNGRDG